MNEKEKKYQKDKERIQQICKRYNVKSRKLLNSGFILVDRNHRIAVCSNAKVGSSTWRYHLRDLLPYEIKEKACRDFNISLQNGANSWWKVLRPYYSIRQNNVSRGLTKKLSPHIINNFLSSHQILSFSFVRHPFERLVSAYVSKIKDTNRMLKMNDKHISEWFKKEKSFSSFVNLVLYEYRRSCYPNNTQISRINTKWSNENCKFRINPHWRPFTFKCNYCDINYDVIGRMETWNEDLNYIIQKAGLQKVFPINKANTSHINASKLNTKEKTREYFTKLSQIQKEDLYHMFQLDFEMFNYDPKMYL